MNGGVGWGEDESKPGERARQACLVSLFCSMNQSPLQSINHYCHVFFFYLGSRRALSLTHPKPPIHTARFFHGKIHHQQAQHCIAVPLLLTSVADNTPNNVQKIIERRRRQRWRIFWERRARSYHTPPSHHYHYHHPHDLTGFSAATDEDTHEQQWQSNSNAVLPTHPYIHTASVYPVATSLALVAIQSGEWIGRVTGPGREQYRARVGQGNP